MAAKNSKIIARSYSMTLVEKFVAKYECGDIPRITFLELFQLVENKILRPETAERIAKEILHGANTDN